LTESAVVVVAAFEGTNVDAVSAGVE